MARSILRILFALSILAFAAGVATAAHFPDPTPTGYMATVAGTPVLTPTLAGVGLTVGDEVAAFSVHGKPGIAGAWERTLIGHVVVDNTGEIWSTPFYGDDGLTTGTVEGAVEGEEICLVLWKASEGREYGAYVNNDTGQAGRLIWQSGGLIDLSTVDFRAGQRIPLRNGAWNLVSYGALSGYHVGPTPPATPQLRNPDGTQAFAWQSVAALQDAFPLRSIQGRYTQVQATDSEGTKMFNPALPASTLDYLAPGYGYWISMVADTQALSWMTVPGAAPSGQESLALQSGLNLVGFWDNQVYYENGQDVSGLLLSPVSTPSVVVSDYGDFWAQSAGTSYQQVQSFDASGALTWDPLNADFSTLKYAAPGSGYYLVMFTEGSLRYPFSSAPLGVAAVAGDNQVTVSWKAVPGAESYTIYWSNLSGVKKGSGSAITINSTSYDHTGLTNGVPYYYVVTVVRGGLESGESAEVSATPTSLNPAPTITAFAPSSGKVDDLVFIDGTGFAAGATTVSFHGTAATVALLTDNQVIVPVPTGATTGSISVTTPGGTATSAGSFEVLVLPTIGSVAPMRGPVGTVVTITGTAFDNTFTIVEFNGLPSTSATVVDPTHVRAVVPAGATDGIVTVVTRVGGTGVILESADVFRVISVASVTPLSGPVGTAISIVGTNFDSSARLFFANGASADNVVYVSPTRVTARVSAGAASGPMRLEFTGVSTAVTTPSSFIVIPAPVISGFLPASAPTGAAVAILGAAFDNVTAVRFGVTPAAFDGSYTSGRIVATVPSLSAGSVTVSVDASGGTASGTFDVKATPVVDNVSPPHGAVGTSVVLSGSGFDNTFRLSFNGIAASIVSLSSTRIDTRVPTGATTGLLALTFNGVAVGSGGGTFTVDLPPTISDFSPTIGKVGTTVTVTGTNFDNTAVVRFNGRSAATTYVSTTSLTALVPNGATTGSLSVSTAAGMVFSGTSFRVVAVTGVSPDIGLVGASVTVSGTNFDNTAQVSFNGTPAATTFVNATTLTVAVPSGATTGLVSVSTAGLSVTGTTVFRVVSVTGVSPSVAASGSSVTIAGTYFDDTSLVRFFDNVAAVVTARSATSLTATVPSAAGTAFGPVTVVTQGISASSPSAFTPALTPSGVTAVPGDNTVMLSWSPAAGASSYKIYWGTAPGVTKASPTSISGATSPYLHTGRTNGTTYYYVVTATTSGVESAISAEVSARPVSSLPPAPTLDGVAPVNIDRGKAGETVHVYGANFLSGGTSVSFNGVPAAVSVIDNTHLQASVPPTATSGPIIVSTAGGSVTSSFAFRVASVSDFNPKTGKAGDIVVVAGTAFDNVVEVRFGSIGGPTAAFAVPSDNQVNVTVPATAVGGKLWIVQGRFDRRTGASIPLTTLTASDFTFLPAPTITSFTPPSGPVGTTVTVNGVNLDNAAVTLNGISAPATPVGAGQISFAVPAVATTGPITVTTWGGTVASGTNFLVVPRIASLSPGTGVAGDSVTITGSGFDNGTTVSFSSHWLATPVEAGGAWSTLAPMPTARFSLAAGSINGKIYVTGGTNGNCRAYSALEEYDPVSDTWATKAPMPTPRYSLRAGVVDGILYSIGGANNCNAYGTYATVEAYDPGTDTWATKAPMPTSRQLPAVGVVGGKLYAVGGQYGYTVLATVEEFDPASNTWTGKAPLPKPLVTHVVGVINGILYVAGGYTVVGGTGILNTDVYAYDPGSNAWTTVASIPTPRTYPSSGVVNGKFYILGGSGAGGSVATVESYDPTANSWTTEPSMPTARQEFPTIVANNVLYAIGGAGGGSLATNEAFTPAGTHNNAPAFPVTVVSPTELLVTVPDNAVTGKVTVVTSGGTGQSAGIFHAVPRVASFSPFTGPTGTSFSIYGTGFDPAMRFVKVDQVPIPFTRVSPTRIDAQLNSLATTGKITIDDPFGSPADSSADFNVQPTISGFGPTSGTEGSLVTITGANFDNDVQVRFFDTVAAVLVEKSATSVQATVPPTAQTGPITVVTRGGSAVTGTPFTVYRQPSISNVSPLSGAVGDNVIITGTNFDNTATVYFNGVFAPVTSVTSTQIRTNVPPSATTGPVSVATTGGGGSGNFSSFTVAGAPTISSVSPTSGSFGTDVTIDGTHFQTGVASLSVRFNGVPADNVTVVSDNQVLVKVPAAAGTGPVSVSTNYGTAYSPSNFTVTASVTSFTPQIGTINTAVTIDGSGFDPSTVVRFNGLSASVVTVSGPQRVIANVPPGATSGPISIVTSAGGTVSTASPFHVVSITGISPTTGPSGTIITVSGTWFDNATTVKIGGVAAGVSTWTDNSLTFAVPSDAVTGKIQATVQGLTAASAATFFVQPTISGFALTSGSAGDNVTISGANFDNGAIVTFNGALATVLSRAPGSIVALVPPTATTGRIAVTTAGGTATSGSDFTVVAKLTGFTPPSAPRGATVSIVGSGFAPSSQVSFNGTPATASFVSAAQLNAIVPDTATTGKISVTTPSGTLVSDNNFLAVPTITGFTPLSGSVGAVVTVNGYNFDNTAGISFNGTPAATTRISAVSLSAPVPFGATTGKISVTTIGGTAVSVADFVVIPLLGTTPYVSDGNTVLLDHFDGGTLASINGYTSASGCGFTYPATTPNYSYGAGPSGLSQSLTLSPPTGQPAGSATYIKYPGGQLLSRPNGTIELWIYLTSWGQAGFDQGPYYTSCYGWTFGFGVSSTGQLGASFWPPSSMDSGATKVPLNTWTHVAATWGSTGAKLYINGTQVGSSANTWMPEDGWGGSVMLRAFAPMKIDELRISNVQRTTFNVSHEVPLAPSITSLSPTSGPVGTPVTISGSNFDNSAVVTFSSGVAATRTVVSSSRIDTVVPVGAVTGPITVTTLGGTAVSSQVFTTSKLYDAREYLPLRLGDYSLRQDGYAGITHRTRVIDNVLVTFTRNIQSSPNDYTDDLFAFDPADGKMKQYGVREGDPRVRYAYSPAVVVGSNAMAVGDTFANTYTVTNTITGFAVGRTSSFTFEAVESVTTPAGTFDNCVKISFTDNTGGSGAVWLAKGIGVVQERTQTGALNPATYIMANGVAYGTPPARIPAGDNVSGLYGLDVTTSSDGLVFERNIYNIVHDAGTNALDVTRFSPTAPPAPRTGSVDATGTAFTLHGLTTTSQPMTVGGVFTPNAEVFVGQWWVDSNASVKFPVAGVLAYVTPPRAGDEAIYRVDGGLAGIKDSLYTGPLTYAGDNTAFRRDNFSGLAAAGAPMGLQEWFSVQNMALMELGNSVWPVYVPSLRLLPKRYVLNETYTVFSWLDGSSSSFKVDSVDNVVVPAGTFPLSVRIVETVSRAGSPDTIRYSWHTSDIRGMVHVKAQEGAHVEELMWYRIDGNPYGGYPTNAPTITSFSPTSGPVGTPVSIYGVNFDNSALVTFSNGVPASSIVVSSTRIDTTVPPGTVSGPIRVTQGVLTSVSPASFTLAASSITSFTPDNGVAGTAVTIYGSNFDNTASVYFYNNVLASSTYISSSEIHATVPSGASTGAITVVAAGGTAVSGSVFTVPLPPSPPEGVSALGLNGAVVVSWTGGSGGGVTYKIYRGTSPGVTKLTGTLVYSAVLAGGMKQFTDNGVANGTPYYYVVTASNANGESAESMEVTATPTASATFLGGPTPYLQKRQTGTGAVTLMSWIPMNDPSTGVPLEYTAVVAGSGTVTGPDGGPVSLLNQARQGFRYVPLDNTGNPVTLGGMWTRPSPAAGDLPTGFYHLSAVDNAGRTYVRDAWYDNSVVSPGTVDTATMSGSWGSDGSLTFTWDKPAGMTTSANSGVRMRVVIQTKVDVNGDGLQDWVYISPDNPLNDSVTTYGATVDAASMAYLKALYPLDNMEWHVEVRHIRTGYEVYRHNSINLNLPVSGSGPAANSISGTVSGGTGSGRIYLNVQQSGGGTTGYGTSVSGSGPYTIRGVTPGSYIVTAYRDLLGTGIGNAADPTGTSGTVNLTSGNVGGANVTLSDPSPFSPSVPGGMTAVPGDSGVFVSWDTPKDGNGREIAASYNLYWHTDNTVSPTHFTGSATGIKARNDAHYFASGLVNGTTYWYVATATLLDNVTTSAPSAVSAPATIGAPVGGHTISGTVTFPGVTPTGPLYIALGAGMGGMPVAVAGIASPTPDSQSFSVSGVPDGMYSVYAILDQNNTHVIDVGDLSNTDGGNTPIVTVSGVDVTSVSVALPTGNAVASIRTSHGMGTGEWYNISPAVRKMRKLPVKVVLAGGPNVPPVVDIGGDNWEFYAWITTPRPNVGDNYVLNVTYSDNTTEVFVRPVTAVLDSFATPTHPVGLDNTADSTTPTFTWTAPPSPPSPYSYNLWMNGPDASWNMDNRMPSTQTSVLYNVDGRASSPSLTIGNTYNWTISVTDAAGNKTQYNANFTPGIPVAPPSPSITSFTPDNGVYGTSVTIYGSNFDNTSSVYFFNNVLTSSTVVSSSQIDTTVPAGASTGVIKVTTSGGTGTSATSFTIPLPPSPPAGVSALGLNGAVVVSWTGGVGATTFNVYRGTSPGVTKGTGSVVYSGLPGGGTGRLFTDNGVVNGTTYYYIVTALNANGESVESMEASATPTATATVLGGASPYLQKRQTGTGGVVFRSWIDMRDPATGIPLEYTAIVAGSGTTTGAAGPLTLSNQWRQSNQYVPLDNTGNPGGKFGGVSMELTPAGGDLPTGFYRVSGVDNAGRTQVRDAWYDNSVVSPGPVDTATMSGTWGGDGSLTFTWDKPSGITTTANPSVQMRVVIQTTTDVNGDGLADWVYMSPNIPLNDGVTTYNATVDAASMAYLKSLYVLDGLRWRVEVRHNRSGYEVYRHITNNFNLPASGAGPTAYSISGTVSGGTGSGRIYVNVQWNGGGTTGYGTSVAGPGPYTIRGVAPGTYQVTAYRDLLGTGIPNAADPSGMSGTVNLTSGDVGGANVTLSDPSPFSPSVPGGVTAVPGDSGVLVLWDTPTDGNGREIAASYNLYWHTDNTVSPTTFTGSAVGIKARNDAHYFASGLVNGTTYYYVATAMLLDNVTTSAPSAVSAPVTIGAPVGGHTISGTVTFPGVTPTGPLYIALGAGGNGMPVAVAGIASPTSPQAFSVSGVPDGMYAVYVILDQNNNHVIDVGDLSSTDSQAPIVTVSGVDVTGVSAPLPTGNAQASVQTSHGTGSGGEWFNVIPRVDQQRKLPVKVVLAGGPNVPPVVDIGKPYEKFQAWITTPRPNVGDNYVLNVTYSDNTTEVFVRSVTVVLDSFATPTHPVGADSTADSTTPTFTWTAPPSPPTPAYNYHLYMNGPGASWSTDYEMPSTQTSVLYNVDGRASTPSLTIGNTYNWTISVEDAAGNQAQYQTSFTPQTPVGPTITSFTPDNGVYGASVTIYGTNFDNTASVYFYNNVLASSTYVSSSQINTTVPSGASTGPITVTTAGGSAVSGTSFTVPLPPSPPVSVSALGVNGAVQVSWTSVQGGGITFKLYRGTSPGVTKGTGSVVYTGAGSVRQFTDNGVANGTPYYYIVTASNVNGESVESMEASATPTVSATVLGGASPYLQKRQTGTGSVVLRSWLDMKDPATGVSLEYTAVVAGSGVVTGAGGPLALSNQWRITYVYGPLDNTGNPVKIGGVSTEPSASDLPTGFYRLSGVDNAGRTYVRDAWYDNSVVSPGTVDTATMSGSWNGDGSLTFTWNKPSGMTTSANPSVQMRVVIQTKADVNGDGLVDWVYMSPNATLNDSVTTYNATVDAASMAYLKSLYVLDGLNWHVEVRHNRSGYEVYRHNSNNLNLPVSGSGPAAYSISGTVSGGSGSGRIYLNVQPSGGGNTGYGTSVGGSGSYTIRGVTPGSYIVTAYRDLLGTGRQNAADPAGTSGTVNLTSGNVGGANVTLSDPSPFSPSVPGGVTVIPGDSGALVFWDTPKDGNGREIAASYNLYWHTDNTVSPTTFTGSATGIKARDDGHYFASGLPNGSTYYFVVTASLLDNVTTSAPSAVSAPATIGAGSGRTISGTVTFPGVTPTGPLYIFLMAGNKGMPVAVAGIASPTPDSQSFSISGVPDGTYGVYAVLDQNNNHVVDAGDLANMESGNVPMVTVSGGDVSGVSSPLLTENAQASVRTSHSTDGSLTWYNVIPTVREMRKLPVKVVLVGGPNVPPMVDIGKGNNSGGEFNVWINTPRPNVGDNYVLNVTYSDNTTEVLVRSVTAVLDSFATPTHPVGVDSTPDSTTPTFMWTAPASPPTPYSYYLWMNGPDASWNINDRMPSTQTSVLYNVDGNASTPSLTIGNTYNWTITVDDAAGNQAQYNASFTPN